MVFSVTHIIGKQSKQDTLRFQSVVFADGQHDSICLSNYIKGKCVLDYEI